MNDPFFYICNDPERALGLEKLIPNLHIVCIDDSPMLDAMIASGVRVFSLLREHPELGSVFRNSNKLLSEKYVQEYISLNTPTGVTPNVIVFKVAPNIERTASRLGYRLLNTSAELNHKFEEKISQYRELAASGLNFPLTKLARLESLEFNEIASELGLPFVVQFNRGHTGLGTIFINEESEFNSLKTKFPKREVRVSQFINGEAWTINACVTRLGIAYGGLCYQITGVEGLTDQKGGTVGNDWSRVDSLSSNTIEKIETIVKNAGQHMARAGYKGLFGMDLIVDSSGDVFTIEINARQPASTGMHTKLMLKAGLVPLQLLHIAEFRFDSDLEYKDFIFSLTSKEISPEFIAEQNKKAIQKIEASQVVIRQLAQNSLNFNEREQGVYENNQKIAEGYCIDQLARPEELLLLKQKNTDSVSIGSEIARIQGVVSHEKILEMIDTLK